MAQKRVTIKDIAQKLNLHHTTVSLALRNSPRIKAETRKLIHDTARELNYTPNLLALSFRSNRTFNIGVVVPDIHHHFFSKFISEFSKLAYKNGYSIMVFQSSEQLEIEKQNVEVLLKNQVDGIAASISIETIDDSHFQRVIDANVPLVLFDRVPESLKVNKVLVNNYDGAYKAVELLIKAGKRKIAHITGPCGINVYGDRLKGYKAALADFQIPFHGEYLIIGGFYLADGMRAAEQLMHLSDKPDAIFTVGDDLAVGVMKYLKNEGVKIPDDIAVIGFDNDPVGIAIDPELTTVEQPVQQIAQKTFELLIDQIQSEAPNVRQKSIILEPELIVRHSA